MYKHATKAFDMGLSIHTSEEDMSAYIDDIFLQAPTIQIFVDLIQSLYVEIVSYQRGDIDMSPVTEFNDALFDEMITEHEHSYL